jgi:hypothetical protein
MVPIEVALRAGKNFPRNSAISHVVLTGIERITNSLYEGAVIMKHLLVVVAVVASLGCTTVQAAPGGPAAKASTQKTALIEKNIVNLLTSGNLDLQTGGIQNILELRRCCPEMDLDYAVIPLLSCLRDENSPELRVMAATALYEIGGHIGRYAVERRALYDTSEWAVRQLQRIRQAWDGPRTVNSENIAGL